MSRENTNTGKLISSKHIKVTYDKGSPEGDYSGLAFYKGSECIGQLIGEAADYVYHALHQLDALLEWKRENDND